MFGKIIATLLQNMTRNSTKIGDVFAIKVDDNHEKYFQLIAFDLTQLNSDVIRAFEDVYPCTDRPDIASIINGKVQFYAHCVTKAGLKLGLWEKIGHTKNVGSIGHILFRCASDAGTKIGEERVTISKRWHIWHINDKDYTSVGILTGENRNAELGMVVSPYHLIERMKTGKYNFLYPSFE